MQTSRSRVEARRVSVLWNYGNAAVAPSLAPRVAASRHMLVRTVTRAELRDAEQARLKCHRASFGISLPARVLSA
jgi:hypothetical protein